MASATLVSAGGSLSGPLTPPLYVPNLPVAGVLSRYMTKYLGQASAASVDSMPDLGSRGVPLIQTVAEKRPVVAMEGTIKTLAFDGVDDTLFNIYDNQNPLTDRAETVYAAIKLPAFVGSQRIPMWLANMRFVTNASGNTLTLWGATANMGGPAFTPGWHFLGMRRFPDGKAQYTLDGSSSAVSSVNTGTATNSRFVVGGSSETDTTFPCPIGLAEVGIYRGTGSPLTDANMQSIRTALKAMYPFLP